MFPMFGEGIFIQEGDAWKRSRELLRPQLVYKQYGDLQLFHEPFDDLMKRLPAQGGVVDLQPLFFQYTLDVTTAFLFGESVGSLRSTESKDQGFATAFDLAQKYVVKRFRLLDLYWLIGGSELGQACKMVHAFADEIIDRNLSKDALEKEESNSRYVFLRSIAKAYPDRDMLRGQIINILVAGRDTTACLLSWVL